MEREIEVLRVVAASIEQGQDRCQRWDEDEQHAGHCLAGATRQSAIVLGHRAEHPAKQPRLRLDLALDVGALRRRQTASSLDDRLGKGGFARRRSFTNADAESDVEGRRDVRQRRPRLHDEIQDAAQKVEANRPDVAVPSAFDHRACQRPGMREQQTKGPREFSVPADELVIRVADQLLRRGVRRHYALATIRAERAAERGAAVEAPGCHARPIVGDSRRLSKTHLDAEVVDAQID